MVDNAKWKKATTVMLSDSNVSGFQQTPNSIFFSFREYNSLIVTTEQVSAFLFYFFSAYFSISGNPTFVVEPSLTVLTTAVILFSSLLIVIITQQR